MIMLVAVANEWSDVSMSEMPPGKRVRLDGLVMG
jgi:hypothetical protein